jgi:hypothetical protein
MRAKGIGYDTGFIYQGSVSRERFDLEVVRRELAIIRDDLHCNAVQIAGGDPDRLEQAARCAAELGLVFVAGAELTIMNRGFAAGNTLQERLGGLLGEPGRRKRLVEVSERFNDFLVRAVAEIRERFAGRVTYASIPFERPDWTLFDIVSVELIRSPEVAGQYRDAVRSLVAGGKPVAITGFGTCAYAGAVDRGARAMEIVEYDQATQAPLRLDGEYTRDDLDLASPAIVKTLEGRHGDTYPDMTWEPKAAFTAIADCYRG